MKYTALELIRLSNRLERGSWSLVYEKNSKSIYVKSKFVVVIDFKNFDARFYSIK